MGKKLQDTSSHEMHEGMLKSTKGEKTSQINAFKMYAKMGYSREEALSMAGIKLKK